MTTAAGRDADAASDLGGGGLDPILAGVMLRSGGLMAGTMAQVARAVAQSPGAAARHAARGLRRQLHVAAGAGEELPELDRRFADPAWRDNPFLRRLAQSYLVWSDALRDGVAQTPLDNLARYRATFLLDNVIAAASPTNVPLVNPASAKMAYDTAGASLLRGLRQFTRDVRRPPRLPCSPTPRRTRSARTSPLPRARSSAGARSSSCSSTHRERSAWTRSPS